MRFGTSAQLAVHAAFGLATIVAAHAAELSGRVLAVGSGEAIAQATVTLTFADGAGGPKAVSVFTDGSGSFKISGKSVERLPAGTLEVRKLGFKQVNAGLGGLAQAPGSASESKKLVATLYLAPETNIAAEAPASAWLAAAPAGDAKNITIASCSSCHQFPSPRVREYAAKIEAVSGPAGSKKSLKEWRKVVRHEAWRAAVKYMRAKHYSVFPYDSAMNLDAVDWPTAQNVDYNLFNGPQGETIAKYLADHFPTSTAALSRDAYDYGARLASSDRTVIREYAFPPNALVRELVSVPKSRYLWGADVMRSMIVRLDPENGETKWYSVPFNGSTGPHTIVPDDSGTLWISMVDNDQFGRFEPEKEKWTLWTLRPSNLPDSASMGGAAIVHDMSIDSRGHLGRDAYGQIWITLVGSNQMGTLDPESGRVAFYDVNRIPGLSPINHLIYSTVVSADGKYAWYSQVNGHVGRINAQTKRVDNVVPFREGAGPRRMARDNAGNLYVAMFGSGQVARINTRTAKLAQVYDLPDRAAAPYAVSWDERRQVVWAVTANGDVVYRLDPKTSDVKVIPLPRPMAFMRQLAIDQRTGNLIGAYGNYPAGSGPSMGVVIEVGD